MLMSKTASALSKKTAVTHGLELYGYFVSRKIRKNINLYELENSLISKYKAYKDYKTLEKDLSNDKPTSKKKEVVKLL